MSASNLGLSRGEVEHRMRMAVSGYQGALVMLATIARDAGGELSVPVVSNEDAADLLKRVEIGIFPTVITVTVTPTVQA
jgi:hypothetical protein